jgi:hypothetical protein
MVKTKMYRYLGRNGIITTPILLDSIEHIAMFKLRASEGKLLTNGEIKVKTQLIFADELKDWYEINE